VRTCKISVLVAAFAAALGLGAAGAARAEDPAAGGGAGHVHVPDVHDHAAPGAGGIDLDAPEPRADLGGRIDLAALRLLAVQDGGRRKPFDTFAREKVKLVLGTDGFKGEDPVYTFLSLVFEPDRWMPIRAVKIHNLKLIELFDNGSNRISFGELRKSEAFRARLDAIDPNDRMTGPNENAVLELNHRWLMFANLPRTIRVAPIPGSRPESQWSDLTELEGQPPAEQQAVQGLFQRAGRAFRRGDAAATSAALNELAAKLTALQGDRAPDLWRMKLETAMNRTQPFHAAWMVFVLAACLFGAAAITGSRRARTLGLGLHMAGVALALFGVIARTVIVERAPVANLYEAMTFAVFAAVLIGTFFELSYKNAIFGAAASTFGFFALLLADLSPNMDKAISPLVPVLRSYWLNIHVTAMLTSYGTFAVAFLIGIFYFAKYLAAKGLPRLSILVPIAISLAGTGILFWRAYTHQMPKLHDYAFALLGSPLLAIGATWLWLKGSGKIDTKIAYQDKLVLDALDKYMYRVCQVGFVVITGGIILGAVWANESWGRYWGWDPKETWAFITWLVYGVYIHGRIAGLFRGTRSAIWGIVGFYAVLFTFFGVSFVLPGLHSYLKS
jgi:cytochrome c-type biogenesis protein CcsB